MTSKASGWEGPWGKPRVAVHKGTEKPRRTGVSPKSHSLTRPDLGRRPRGDDTALLPKVRLGTPGGVARDFK